MLVIDRYEIGERQTSACAMPTVWLEALDLMGSHAPDASTSWSCTRRSAPSRWQLPWSFSTFDYRELCALLWEQADDGERRVRDRDGHRARRATPSHTDRGELRAPLIVDALGWRRVLSNAHADPAARTRACRAGWRSTRAGSGEEMELWIDPRYVRAGYGWSFPAGDELRVGVGSFWPSPPRQGADRAARRATSACRPRATRATGSRTSCARAIEDGVFFVGDSAGHCLPLTAEGIRTALYFGLACGRELRAVRRRAAARASRRSRATAPSRTRTRANSAGCCTCSARSGR